MYGDEYVLSIAVERWRNIMSWTPMFALKALVFIGLAIAIAVYGNPEVPEKHLWAFIATYALTGVVFLMFGMLLDARENAQRPQKVEVLLRHDGKAWLLNVMRNRTGELYAPLDESMRTMRPVDLNEVSEDILGCPRFITNLRAGDDEVLRRFRVLGKIYTPQA